jgi:hypothetical protein
MKKLKTKIHEGGKIFRYIQNRFLKELFLTFFVEIQLALYQREGIYVS